MTFAVTPIGAGSARCCSASQAARNAPAWTEVSERFSPVETRAGLGGDSSGANREAARAGAAEGLPWRSWSRLSLLQRRTAPGHRLAGSAERSGPQLRFFSACGLPRRCAAAPALVMNGTGTLVAFTAATAERRGRARERADRRADEGVPPRWACQEIARSRRHAAASPRAGDAHRLPSAVGALTHRKQRQTRCEAPGVAAASSASSGNASARVVDEESARRS